MISYYAYPGLKNVQELNTLHSKIGRRNTGHTPEHLLNKVCEFYNQDSESVKGVCRKRELVWCRHVFFYFCHQYTSMTKVQIGEFMGGRDHTTVIHGEKTVQDILDTDASKIKELREIEYMILFVPVVGVLDHHPS